MKRLFDAHFDHAVSQGQVEEMLVPLLGVDEFHEMDGEKIFDRFTFNYYDYSFELHDVKDGWEPPSESYDALRKMGFTRVWVNYRCGEPRGGKPFSFAREEF